MKLKWNTPVLAAAVAPSPLAQDMKFVTPEKGRYSGPETLSPSDGKLFAAMAELDLFSADGQPLSHDGWRFACVDSKERLPEDGSAEKAIDRQTADYRMTEWSRARPHHPHRLVIGLGQLQTLPAFRYLPRAGAANLPGRIKNYRVYVCDDLVQK